MYESRYSGETYQSGNGQQNHDDVIKWKHFPRYWPLVRESTGDRWRRALIFLCEQTAAQTVQMPVIWDRETDIETKQRHRESEKEKFEEMNERKKKYKKYE